MKVKDLVERAKDVDLGVFLKFYGRIFFASVALILIALIFVQSFLVAPAWTLILLVFILSGIAWIVGEILTAEEGPEGW